MRGVGVIGGLCENPEQVQPVARRKDFVRVDPVRDDRGVSGEHVHQQRGAGAAEARHQEWPEPGLIGRHDGLPPAAEGADIDPGAVLQDGVEAQGELRLEAERADRRLEAAHLRRAAMDGDHVGPRHRYRDRACGEAVLHHLDLPRRGSRPEHPPGDPEGRRVSAGPHHRAVDVGAAQATRRGCLRNLRDLEEGHAYLRNQAVIPARSDRGTTGLTRRRTRLAPEPVTK